MERKKMKIRRILIITVFELFILAFMIFSMRDFTVLAIDLFWDLKAFLLIVCFPFGILLLTNSFNSMATYIYMPFDKKENTKEDLENGITFYSFAEKSYFFSGILIFFISIMMMLSDISSIEMIAKNLGTALCAIIYALFIVVILISPLKNTLEVKLNKIH